MACDVETLELHVAQGRTDPALDELHAILRTIDRSYGGIADLSRSGSSLQLDERERTERFATRLASAIGTLITDKRCQISDGTFARLIAHHRWINVVFQVSGFRSAEHVIFELLHRSDLDDRDRLLRLLVVLPTHALSGLNLADFLAIDPSATLAAALSFIGTRYCFSTNEYDLREGLLEQLPGRLDQIRLDHIQPNMLVEPYMMCSYATTQRKHDIKADIIALMREACLDGGCREWDGAEPPRRAKPEIIVTTEGFGPGHSVFRTHSRAVMALRDKFHVVGLCFQASVTPQSRSCFDEILLYPRGPFIAGMRALAEVILDRRPDMILQLGVGMAPQTIALASLRLARVQAASFAHTATSNSPFVDHMILPEDFVSDPAAFTEPLVMLPPGAMPYTLRPDGAEPSLEARSRQAQRRPGQPVKIGLPAAIMKLNPRLFAVLQRISEQAASDVEVHFFPLGAVGLGRLALERSIPMPNAVVHPELDYADYLRQLGDCDLFLCPFPYGNVNSVVDCIRLGLPGVCLDGRQPHAHADASLFRRAGLPEALISSDLDEYVAAAVRLVDEDQWRLNCREAALAADLQSPAFSGNAAIFADQVLALLN